MFLVTGAAGFIGSCIVAALNERGENDLILVDDLNEENSFREGNISLKKANLQHKKYAKYLDKNELISLILKKQFPLSISCIIHMGANSSTTLEDAQYFKINNLDYTRILAQTALDKRIPFIYASSAATYGDGSIGYKDDDETIRQCRPLNLYGQSKQDFDLWALDNKLLDKLVGLKFFNVFGPNEYHKGDMRSVVAKAYKRVADEGKISLFKSYHKDYRDGEQKRDFIYVKDAVNILLHFVDNPKIAGIFNVGTGKARTWNDLAFALFKSIGKTPHIDYMEMPESLREKYQYFTQADMAKLKNSGYKRELLSLEDAIVDYVKYLKDQKHY